MSAGSRVAHVRWGPMALVFAGGAAGVAGREGLALVIPNPGEVSVAIPVINVIGAFLLGCLYEAITRTGSSPTGRKLKLLLGTGFCGGFTTYSSLATGTALYLSDSLPWTALMYALGTVLVGACGTWAGIAVGSRISTRGPGGRNNGGRGVSS
jgi:CrcB protein